MVNYRKYIIKTTTNNSLKIWYTDHTIFLKILQSFLSQFS